MQELGSSSFAYISCCGGEQLEDSRAGLHGAGEEGGTWSRRREERSVPEEE